MTARDVIVDALVEIGAYEPGEPLSPDDLSLGLSRLQKQVAAWAADQLTLSTRQQLTIPLAPGTPSITIGPTGQIVAQRPLVIDTLNYVIPGSAPEVEVPIALAIDSATFQQIAIKKLPSNLPTQAFYQTLNTGENGVLAIWPEVTQAVKLYAYVPLAIDVPATPDTIITGPPGFEEAFLYQLALRLCNPFGVKPPDTLPEMARHALMTMQRPNATPGLLGLDPALTGAGGSGYNILTDQVSSHH